MTNLVDDFGKWWLESTGRGRTAFRYSFRESEIVTAGFSMRVSPWWNAIYLNLHPTHFAVAIGPDGRIMNLRGGYNKLIPGRYTIHYVDKQNRVTVVPRTTETTFDGFQVSLELVVTYRVIDPIKALEVQQAVDTLIVFIQSDLKEFIRSHKYNEIVGDMEGSQIDNDLVTRYIKAQHATRHQMSKLFLVSDIVVEEKIGDPRVNEIREKYQLNQRQYTVDSEIQRQNQELEKKVADQEAALKQIKTTSEANLQDLVQRMELQRIELERARAELQFKQEKWLRAIDAISQSFSTQNYPRDPREVEIISELLSVMGESTPKPDETSLEEGASPPAGTNGAANTKKIDELTNTLLNWMKRKRS